MGNDNERGKDIQTLWLEILKLSVDVFQLTGGKVDVGEGFAGGRSTVVAGLRVNTFEFEASHCDDVL